MYVHAWMGLLWWCSSLLFTRAVTLILFFISLRFFFQNIYIQWFKFFNSSKNKLHDNNNKKKNNIVSLASMKRLIYSPRTSIMQQTIWPTKIREATLQMEAVVAYQIKTRCLSCPETKTKLNVTWQSVSAGVGKLVKNGCSLYKIHSTIRP